MNQRKFTKRKILRIATQLATQKSCSLNLNTQKTKIFCKKIYSFATIPFNLARDNNTFSVMLTIHNKLNNYLISNLKIISLTFTSSPSFLSNTTSSTLVGFFISSKAEFTNSFPASSVSTKRVTTSDGVRDFSFLNV